MLFAHKDMPLLSWLKKNWKTLAVMCISVLVAVGVRTANMAYYRSNPAALDYYEENAVPTVYVSVTDADDTGLRCSRL